MKIIGIHAEGLPLFKNELNIGFTVTQRVSDDDKGSLIQLFNNIYLNPTEAIIGINASGKTSVLKVVLLVLGLLNNEPINHLYVKDILGKSDEVVISTVFFSNDSLYKLKTKISFKDDRYIITDEVLMRKSVNDVKSRKTMLEFDDSMIITTRQQDEEFLSDDVSIVIAHNKKNKEHMLVEDMLSFTNINVLPISDEIPLSIISFLDPTVKELSFERQNGKELIHLVFKGQDEIVLNNARELENYLSSGTIKGIITFSKAMEVLRLGGYMVIDEVENHFNKEIVATLIRFFMDNKLNKNGAVLVFSTHYPELLDEYDRNDSIYITRNRDGIELKRLTEVLSRNDIKRSEAYQSGLLDGTTPAYEAYMQLKKSIAAYV
jgi:predicted ATP-dependent endonuclease of OLD family